MGDVVLVWIALACVKVLLFPAYHSTDFEVHRNWLAITGYLPIREWYFNDTSEWTLDYPPLFAYFEWVLFQLSRFIDPDLIQLDRYNDDRFSVVCFQRSTVILTELVLAWATVRYLRSSRVPSRLQALAFGAIVGNGGLLLVDHIHFQYNGFLIGILVLTLDFCNKEQYLASAFSFSVLIFLKHLFAPLALPFGVFLLSAYCVKNEKFQFINFLKLVAIALCVVLLAFGPFLLQPDIFSQLQQIFTRLFPFGRGLVHTYWAPNVWALYCFTDRVLLQACANSSVNGVLGSVCTIASNFDPSRSSTTGVLGSATAFAFLPSVSAGVCLGAIVVAMAPALYALAKKPDPGVLIDAVLYCSMCSFMFGYHVHEKAVLIPMILAVLTLAREAGQSPSNSALFVLKSNLAFVLSASGVHGLFPLFNDVQETPVKLFIMISCLYLVVVLVSSLSPTGTTLNKRWTYLWFIVALINAVLVIFTQIIHPAFFHRSALQFLPLMLTSVTCAVQNVVCCVLSLIIVLNQYNVASSGKGSRLKMD